jgi:hypothetical protein
MVLTIVARTLAGQDFQRVRERIATGASPDDAPGCACQ